MSKANNAQAEKLRKLSTEFPTQLGWAIFIKELMTAILEMRVSLVVEYPEDCWTTPFLNYLTEGRLPSDKTFTKKVMLNSPQYVV